MADQALADALRRIQQLKIQFAAQALATAAEIASREALQAARKMLPTTVANAVMMAAGAAKQDPKRPGRTGNRPSMHS